MIILLFIIFIVLTIILSILSIRKWDDWEDDTCLILGAFAFFAGIGAISCVIAFFVNWSKYIDYCTVEERIELVEAKNADIENEIQIAVREYMEHEHKTYKGLSPNNAIAVATAYPELSSNELIKEQISTYKSNRDEILQLKQQTIDRKIKAWWLWFGK